MWLGGRVRRKGWVRFLTSYKYLKLTSFIAFLAAVAVNAQGGADPSINTPTGVVQCLPVQLTFSGTAPPFFISIHPGGQPDTPALKTFENVSGNSVTWTVDQPAGRQLTLVIRDAQGRTNPSAPFNVQPSDNTSCLNGGGGGGGGAQTSAPASQPATSAGGAASSQAGGASGTSRPAASTTSRAPTTSSTPSNAAVAAVQPVGLAGLLGLVGVAALI
ncbi:hypothetical protein FRC03_006709 [Tulasnella sp. 419]|nr:hypothetical protein FRC03_006709 [Tulasnella sp. 419]